MLSGDATNNNVIVFGLIPPGLEPTIYRALRGNANHYTSEAASIPKESDADG